MSVLFVSVNIFFKSIHLKYQMSHDVSRQSNEFDLKKIIRLDDIGRTLSIVLFCRQGHWSMSELHIRLVMAERQKDRNTVKLKY